MNIILSLMFFLFVKEILSCPKWENKCYLHREYLNSLKDYPEYIENEFKVFYIVDKDMVTEKYFCSSSLNERLDLLNNNDYFINNKIKFLCQTNINSNLKVIMFNFCFDSNQINFIKSFNEKIETSFVKLKNNEINLCFGMYDFSFTKRFIDVLKKLN